MPPSRGFLSIVRWPDRSPAHADEPFAEEDGVAILVDAVGLPPADARRAVRRGTPQVTSMLDLAVAPAVLSALRRAGVTAAFVGGDLLESLPPPLRAKRLRPALGAPEPMYAVEPWRGEGDVLLASRIALLVRATLRTVESRNEHAPSSWRSAAASRYMVGGVGGAALSRAMEADGAGESARSTRVRTTEILDVHLADGRCIRVDGDKFSFDVLGEARGVSDRENMDRLAARLRGDAPHAAFDADFSRFACPAQFLDERTWGGARLSGRRSSEHRAFDFYSAWLAGLRQALAAGQKSRREVPKDGAPGGPSA